jgi:HAD superfamily hydrolase (TIGR01509 family)
VWSQVDPFGLLSRSIDPPSDTRPGPRPASRRPEIGRPPRENTRTFPIMPDMRNAEAEMGVIFDVDGVMVDSYRAHFKTWQLLATRVNRTISEQQFAARFGRTSRAIMTELWPELELTDVAIQCLDDRKEADYREIVSQNFPAMPGVQDLIHALHTTGIRLAVGSSGPPENVSLALEKLGAARLFQAVVTGKDVHRGKPDPEVFLIAARRLDIDPSRCVILEDSPAGLSAARSAGMTSIGVCSSGHTHEQLADADKIVKKLSEVSPQIIADLLSRQR